MAWAGTGVLWMMTGGIMKSYGMSQLIDKTTGGLKKGLALPAADYPRSGLTSVEYVEHNHTLAVTDMPLMVGGM